MNTLIINPPRLNDRLIQMKILTWNVDGYNPTIHRELIELLSDEQVDLIFLTEIKCKANKIPAIPGYKLIINTHVPSNYHGVAMIIKDNIEYEEIPVDLNIPPRYDTKSSSAATGRIITIKINDVYLVGVYSPNSGVNGLKNLKYRTNIWDVGLATYLNSLGSNVLLMGDLNIAFDYRDVSDPVSMKRWAGYSIEERKSFKNTMSNFIDIYREFSPNGMIYTWIGNNPRPNYGMRLDHFMVNNRDLYEQVETLLFYHDTTLSDHIPIGIMINI